MPAEVNRPPPKIRSEIFRPELTKLPTISVPRQGFRIIIQGLFRLILWLFTRRTIEGLENYPQKGPALIVTNHLGDTDSALGAVYFSHKPIALAGIEMINLRVLGKIMDWYGVIWVHRGQPDRRALRAALKGLDQGRIIAIAPEGRESVTGVLEEGVGGAAYLALKTGVPLIPVAFTGTENWRVYGNMKKLRRTDVSMKIGPRFMLEPGPDRKKAIQIGTETIMYKIADLLPRKYRGRFETVREGTIHRV
jgi:1-acyl-sn-glycerol-3-phosphate acyltransferase